MNQIWGMGYADGVNNRNPSKYEPKNDAEQVLYITGFRCGVRAQSGLNRARSEEGDRLFEKGLGMCDPAEAKRMLGI